MDEQALYEKHLGRTVHGEGDRIVVNIPVRFRKRNCRQMVFAAGHNAEDNTMSEENALVVAFTHAW